MKSRKGHNPSSHSLNVLSFESQDNIKSMRGSFEEYDPIANLSDEEKDFSEESNSDEDLYDNGSNRQYERIQELLQEQVKLKESHQKVLYDQQAVFAQQLQKTESESKQHVEKVVGTAKKREDKLKKRIEEIHSRMTNKNEEIKNLKGIVRDLRFKYNEQRGKLRTERFQNSLTIGIGINQNEDDDYNELNNMGFGNDWFDEDESTFYDMSEIRNEKNINLKIGEDDKNDGKFFGKIKMWLKNYFHVDYKLFLVLNYLSLREDQKFITSRFGLLIGTYFRIFRIQVLINVFVGFLIFLCYVPHMIYRFLDDNQNLVDNTEDLMLTTGGQNASLSSLFIPPVLTFSAFQKESSVQFQNKIIYFFMIFPPFLVFAITLMIEIINELRIAAKNSNNTSGVLGISFNFGTKKDVHNEKKQMSSYLMNVMNHSRNMTKMAALNCQYESITDIRLILHQKKLEAAIEKRSKFERYVMIIRKVVGWSLIAGIVVLDWASLVFLNLYKEQLSSFLSGFLPVSFLIIPTTITLINQITPQLAVWITNYVEKWDYEENKVKVMIIRLYLLKVVTIGLLCYQYGQFIWINNAAKNGSCAFANVGGELFLLLLMTFVTEFVNGLWPVAFFLYKKIREKMFDVKMKGDEKKWAEKRKKPYPEKSKNSEKEKKRKQKKGWKKKEDTIVEVEEELKVLDEDDKEIEEKGEEKEGKSEEEQGENENENEGENENNLRESENEIEGESVVRMNSNKEVEFKDFFTDSLLDSPKGEEEGENDSHEKTDVNDTILEDVEGDREKDKLEHLKAKKFRKSDQKKVFSTYKKLISLLYFQVIIWLSLPVFPLAISIAAVFSVVIFKYQRYMLQFFFVKEKFPISAGDLGFFFVLLYIMTFFIPLTMYYFLISVSTQSDGCGFSIENYEEEDYSIMIVFKQLGIEVTGSAFEWVYDHVINNTLFLYCLAIGGFVFFVGRESNVRRMKKLIMLSNWKERRESFMHEKKVREKQSEIETLTKKVDKLSQFVKKFKKK